MNQEPRIMQNKPNSKTEDRNQNTEDSKISAKPIPKLRFSVPTNFFYNCRESSTNWPYFLQNKPNLLDAQMNVSSILTKDYENVPLRRRGENKPNSNPIKLNFRQEMPKKPYLPACVKRHYAGTVKAMQPGTCFSGLIDDVRIYKPGAERRRNRGAGALDSQPSVIGAS